MLATVARTWVAALTAVAMAAGCSDSSGSSASRPDYEDLSDEFDALATETEMVAVTEPSALPTSGGATYDGAMLISTSGAGGIPTELAGDLALTADFADDDISGRVTNVASQGGTEYDGSIRLDGGEIDRSPGPDEYQFDYDVNGVLTAGSGDLTFEGDGVGFFGGGDAEYVAGVAGGAVQSSGGAADFLAVFFGGR